MAHDLLAELAGYTNELDRYVKAKRSERAAQVRAEIGRVRQAIAEHVRGLDAAADEHMDAGRDGAAGECTAAARPYTQALADSEGLDADPGTEPETPQTPTKPPAPEEPQTPETDPTPAAEPEERAEEAPAAETAAESKPRRTATTRGRKTS